MSSYSEYLGRLKQRLPQYIDTRPHRDAGHQTEVVKRIAASGTLERPTAVISGNHVLNAPSTQVNSAYKGGHKVQDASLYQDYSAGQEVAQGALAVNAKASQIQAVCYSSTTVPEINDRLAADSQLSAIQAAKNAYSRGWNSANCCKVCGEPAQFTTACPCTLTATQQTELKDAKRRFTTPS
jgi:hypothetical protein